MHGNRVNYITIKKSSNSSKSYLLINLPRNVMDILGDVDRIIIREHPLSISVPTLADKGSSKIGMALIYNFTQVV